MHIFNHTNSFVDMRNPFVSKSLNSFCSSRTREKVVESRSSIEKQNRSFFCGDDDDDDDDDTIDINLVPRRLT
jgi:hypothetical protein